MGKEGRTKSMSKHVSFFRRCSPEVSSQITGDKALQEDRILSLMFTCLCHSTKLIWPSSLLSLLLFLVTGISAIL